MKLEEGCNAVITQDGLIKVEFNAKGNVVRVNDRNIVVNQVGEISTDTCPKIDSLAQKAFQVGDRLRDGTVCIAVDLHKNKALFAPEEIFGGKAKFDNQGEIPAQLNKQNAYSHNDWRNITDDEGKTLSEVWDKVAPDELKGNAAPYFWITSLDDICDNEGQKQGHVRRGRSLGRAQHLAGLSQSRCRLSRLAQPGAGSFNNLVTARCAVAKLP